VSDFGFTDLLSIVQTIAIIAALLISLYFSRKQIQALSMDIESRVLNDIDEKFHRMGEIFIEKPDLIRVIWSTPDTLGAEVPLAYYIVFFCAHIFHVRQRGILKDNEWAGWLQWMRTAFRAGDLGRLWKDGRIGDWIDPDFRRFVEMEVLTQTPTHI
jgi:hypothetical protein